MPIDTSMKTHEKTKPFEQVTARFDISNESAKYFLGRVQKSFKKVKPPQALILSFIESRHFTSLPEPYQVAASMAENGIWDYPLNAAPPVLEDEPDIYK